METTLEQNKENSAPAGGDQGRHLTFHIAVNGVAEEWDKEKMNYEQAVHLAFPNGPFGGDVRYSVTWTKPDGEEGSLRPGQSVSVVDKMLFNVRNTDKS